jgi:hypothetical protein
VLQYTPTSASWLNAVEGFFAKLNRHRLERGVFHSIVDRPLWAGERTRYAGGVLC